ncbi:MAG: 16S rRNA (guanine(527)-N(7))-methyltransferase RsmG [Candidatus Cloacimonetes bacterium]|nr:16S rRNA (guanine(527)-N(7))-methyltransferase RsmG [Candidatus Cloacimonadota bacterium]
MEYSHVIREYLSSCGITGIEEKLEQLTAFQGYLREANEKVNLISRQADAADIWYNHILDSILIIRFVSFSQETILDFGSGGGLPGIPLKILFPETRMYLLDSRNRKMEAVRNILKKLDLTECFPITSRLEELDRSWEGYFDVILSRSVRQERVFKQAMEKLLVRQGKVLLYKSQKLDDLEIFPFYKSYNISHPRVGTRILIEIKKEMFHMEH